MSTWSVGLLGAALEDTIAQGTHPGAAQIAAVEGSSVMKGASKTRTTSVPSVFMMKSSGRQSSPQSTALPRVETKTIWVPSGDQTGC